MNREQLEHAIRAACEISGDHELYIFGSQAILGQFPRASAILRQSIEVDVAPKNRTDKVDDIDGALGENSPFHQTHGFYVHGLSIDAAKLPKGWQERTIDIQEYMGRGYTGYCVEAHDLAAGKLIAFRHRDTGFVRALLVDEMIDPYQLIALIDTIETEQELISRAKKWVRSIAKEL